MVTSAANVMDSPERSRCYAKREKEENFETWNNRAGEDEEWEGSDKRKHRSSKSRKPSNEEEIESLDVGGKRRSSGDRNDGRKRSGGSSRVDTDDDDYDVRNESRPKELKRKQEESSSRLQDGEHETKPDGDKSASRGQARSDESERRKVTSKSFDNDSSLGRKNKAERSHVDIGKTVDRDSRHLERRDSCREKTHGSSDVARSSRRRWDESESSRRADENCIEKDESKGGKLFDSKHEIIKDRSGNETSDGKHGGLDSQSEKGGKYKNREDSRVESERIKSKSCLDPSEEDIRGSPSNQEDRIGRDKHERQRDRTAAGQDVLASRETIANTDEDGNSWPRDKFGGENRSRTPERNVRHHQESENSEMENARSLDLKRKEPERAIHRDDRPKIRDDDWGDRFRDREGSKENWKRRPPSNGDKELRDGETFYDRSRDWELPRHGRDRGENERPHGRLGSRKDGSRGEAVKTSSNFGISNDNYDVIEIQTKPLDYRRAESVSVRRSEVGQQSDTKLGSNEEEWAYMRDDRGRKSDMYNSRISGDIPRDEYVEDGESARDLGSRGTVSGRSGGGQSSVGGAQPPFTPLDPGNFGRGPQGVKGSRLGRGGRGRPTGRDSQQVGLPMPMMGSPFGHLGMPPPGAMQSLPPGISPAAGPPIGPGVFLPPFSPPVVWPGPRGVDMNMLGVPPGLSPVPSGSSGSRFPPNMSTPPNPGLYFNPSGPGRGGPLNASGHGFTGAGPTGRGMASDKAIGDWVPPRTGGPPVKAPSRGEQNDYSQNFVDTGMRPQNFIRELELTNVVEDYPKLRELIQKKDEIVTNSSSPPMYFKCDLREFELSPEFFGTKFDVILIDPPWEEYVHRAPGVADHIEYWTFEEIINLKIEAIADTPSFIFLWVGDGVGLEQGRQCLKKWGFRRCEDICWVKTNKTNATPGLQHDSHTIFQHSKEHCLMGIKGTVRRSTDGHIIHANIDTDVIIAEEPPYGSTQKPEDMYRIIEHFSLGRRRLELFGEDHNIRSGWMTVGKGLSSSNFNSEAYIKNFSDKDGKVWQGGGGRNPPPDAPHLVKTTPDIESLRPKSPMKNQQQQQQQSASISLTTANSSSRRATTANSPQNPAMFALNQEASSSNPSMSAPWASPREGFRGRDGGNMPLEDRIYDIYGYGGQTNGEYLDFESQRPMNIQ